MLHNSTIKTLEQAGHTIYPQQSVQGCSQYATHAIHDYKQGYIIKGRYFCLIHMKMKCYTQIFLLSAGSKVPYDHMKSG